MKALACTVSAIALTITSAAPAAAIDITFDDVTSVGNPVVTLLDRHGYRFTGAFRTIDDPGGTLIENGSAIYLAQPAGFPGVTISRTDGGAFDLYEFAAAPLLVSPTAASPNAQQVSLLAVQVGGAILSGSFSLGSAAGFLHLPVPAAWSNLQFVTLTGISAAGLSGGLAIDDVGVGTGVSSSVPEPGSLLLFAATALGSGAALWTQRRRLGPRALA
jgi:hypothetical protein